MSGEKPRFPSQMQATHENLVKVLKGMGLQHLETHGRYGEPERSVIVYNPSQEQMHHLGKTFGQESVIHSQGGQHKLLYTHGDKEGQYHLVNPAHPEPVEFFDEPPDDYYTKLPGAGYFRINFDLDKLHQSQGGEEAIPQVVGMKKSLASTPVLLSPTPHPHAYDWHDGHSDHHRAEEPLSPVPGLRKDQHPHMDGPPLNDQAAGAGVSTYHKFAAPYGHVQKGQTSNLLHYRYENKLPEIENLVKSHGYKVYYAGGKYGKPDLANKNYNTGHLMVYDPTPQSGGDFGHETYTRGWRQIHELAHALTYPELNKIYGEGRRMGKLGTHRTLNEAARAVHWEHLAAHKQRELGKSIGVHLSDEDFNREYNTVMHDAVHRAVTGKFTEPSQEGFQPHPHAVPLGTAMDMLREEAQKLGLQHAHHTIKKSEDVIFSEHRSPTVADSDQKTYSPEEAAVILKKAAQDRIATFEAELRELRGRELKKALVPPHKHTTGTTSSAGIEDVAPGKLDKGDLCKGCGEAGDLCKCGDIKAGDDIAKDEPNPGESCKKCGGKGHYWEAGDVPRKDVKKDCTRCKGNGEEPGFRRTKPKPNQLTPVPADKIKRYDSSGNQMGKAMLKDAKGKEKDNGIHPDATLPEDKKPEKVEAKGSGGDIKKGKTLKSLHKSAQDRAFGQPLQKGYNVVYRCPSCNQQHGPVGQASPAHRLCGPCHQQLGGGEGYQPGDTRFHPQNLARFGDEQLAAENQRQAQLLSAKKPEGQPVAKSDKYQYYLVHKETGAIHGGNEYKEDAHEAVKDLPDSSKFKVAHRSKVSPEAKAAFHSNNQNQNKLDKAYISPYTKYGPSKPAVAPGKPAEKPQASVQTPAPAQKAEPKANKTPCDACGAPGTYLDSAYCKKCYHDDRVEGGPAKKAEPPMAKPPGGKNMATHMPASKPAAVAAPAAKAPAMAQPAVKAELEKGVFSDAAKQADPVSASHAAAAGAAAPKVKLPGAGAQAQRAQSFQDAAAGAFQPAANAAPSGLELAPKPKAQLASPKAAGIAASPAKPAAAKPGIFGRLMGKSEKK